MQLQIDRRPDGRVIIEIPGNGHDTARVATVHTPALPPIGGQHQGGLYAGLTVFDNDPTELILLPGEFEGNWKDARAWAEQQGGVLPSRVDALILLQNLPGEFRKEAYWTATQHAANPDCAWCQDFSSGFQISLSILSQLRARAVRRLTI